MDSKTISYTYTYPYNYEALSADVVFKPYFILYISHIRTLLSKKRKFRVVSVYDCVCVQVGVLR